MPDQPSASQNLLFGVPAGKTQSALFRIPKVKAEKLARLTFVIEVIDPEVRELVPPKMEVLSTLDSISTQFVPFHPEIDKEFRLFPVNVPTALLELHVNEIFACAPTTGKIYQYSTVETPVNSAATATPTAFGLA
ncbi:hypothetical protein D3C80_1119860 [compost metagenome]